MLKVKNYPSGSILDAKLGYRPYAWRSIWTARDLFKEGLIWRVGYGEKVKIWKDRWIPKPTCYLVRLPKRVLNEEAVVTNLIDKDTRWWNIPLIKEVFEEDEVTAICQIPISSYNGRDQQIWRYTENEESTVKNAYHLEMAMVASGKGECSYVIGEGSV